MPAAARGNKYLWQLHPTTAYKHMAIIVVQSLAHEIVFSDRSYIRSGRCH